MANIQIDAEKHAEFLELYRLWAAELPETEQKRITSLVEGPWEHFGSRVEIAFKVDPLFLDFLRRRKFRFRKI